MMLTRSAGVIEVGEGFHRVALAVQQRGRQRVVGAAVRVLDEPRAHGPQVGLRPRRGLPPPSAGEEYYPVRDWDSLSGSLSPI